MKRCLLVLLSLQAFITPAFNQINSCIHKAYAYSRQVLPGVAPSVVIHENGSTSEKSGKADLQYFIYAELRKSSKIVLKYIWLDGKRHNVTTITRLTPILIENTKKPATQKDTLVAKTSYKVIQIEVMKENQPKGKIAGERIKIQELQGATIEYLLQGKTYFYTISKIKQLPALVLQ